ncbi:MAG: LysR family transcriptional regulator [Rhizobiales bacterium]|jgi:DNA-binding transcriptional LysR family regulator|nr:LysR family transcriptional regulator [Hyphomicrobiales bacterium]OJU38217.1 MAG: hypothetical protein BGN94_05465 [Rhizobiales bacterium 68-8]
MRRPLRFRQIEALRALVEEGSVTKAAERLFVSQPAVSKLLAHLEEDCGFAILERTHGRLSLTPAGYRVYDEIDRVFRGVNQLQEAVDSIRREEEGRLIVAASPVLADLIVPKAIISLIGMNPGFQVTLLSGKSQDVIDKVRMKEVDVGVIFPNYDVSNAYVRTDRIVAFDLVCIMPVGHRLTREKVVTTAHLRGEKFISSPPNSQMRRLIQNAAEKAEIELDFVIETSTATSIADFVAAGLGISLVHPIFTRPKSGAVEVRPFEPAISTHLLSCIPREPRNSTMVSAFIEQMKIVTPKIVGQIG